MQGKENESAQEWMGRLYIKAAKCNYKEHDRQFINVINDEEIMQEIIKEYATQREHEWNRLWTGANMGTKSWGAEGTEKKH